MKYYQRTVQLHQYTLYGILHGVLPLGMLIANAHNPLLPGKFAELAALLTLFLQMCGVGIIFRNRLLGRMLAGSGIGLGIFVLFFDLLANPLLTLFCGIVAIASLYYLFTAKFYIIKPDSAMLLNSFAGCAYTVLITAMFSPLLAYELKLFELSVFLSLSMMLVLWHKYLKKKSFYGRRKTLTGTEFILCFICITAFVYDWILLAALVLSGVGAAWAWRIKHENSGYVELMIRHPARNLAMTFLVLCIGGTLLLRTQMAMNGELGVLDAAFTAVSAACVTGLTVIDTAADLTGAGRGIVLLLIQLGGLGIMTLTTLALHALGKLSLNQEQMVSNITANSECNIFQSLSLIVKFTLAVEAVGAFFLTWGFYNFYGDWFKALELGIFTSVSAFCNAGFFPGAENLQPYAGESLLLLIIALEIILGGIAPAVTLSFIQFRRLKCMPLVSKLVLSTTVILLFGGMFFLLLFEWNGIFSDLEWHDKIINGFFYSATLRTAGFNTVPITALGAPSYMIMLFLMFIGGSPGGTAGGIKTATLAILSLAFRSAIRNEDKVCADQRQIPFRIVIHAIAVFISALLVLFAILLMLVATQNIALQKLVFEAFSALGTVGLSMGATGELDAVGRIVIIAAMFIGRVGPLTLFLLLSERHANKTPGYAPIKIPLA